MVRTAPCQAQVASRAKKTLRIFSKSELYNAVTLCKEGGWSIPGTLPSWHCHSQGTTNAGPFGKLQLGLMQHCRKTSACPILQPKPCHVIATSDFSVAPICSHQLLNTQTKMWQLSPGCRGKKCSTDSLPLHGLLGIQLALLAKAELSCCGLFAQVS